MRLRRIDHAPRARLGPSARALPENHTRARAECSIRQQTNSPCWLAARGVLRDLKAENVLRSGDGPAAAWVICDFGSATSRAKVYDTAMEMATEEDNIRRTTTPAYRAPEVRPGRAACSKRTVAVAVTWWWR